VIGLVLQPAVDSTDDITLTVVVSTTDTASQSSNASINSASETLVIQVVEDTEILDSDFITPPMVVMSREAVIQPEPQDVLAESPTLNVIFGVPEFAGYNAKLVSELNNVYQGVLQTNQNIQGTGDKDFVAIHGAQANAGNVALGESGDLIYISDWGSVTDRSIDGQGSAWDVIVIEASIVQSIYPYSGTAGKVYFNDGGSLIYNNVESVVTTDNTSVWHSVDIVVNAALTDTDGSETLSNVSIDGMPAGVVITQPDQTDITTDGGVFDIVVSTGEETLLNAVYQGSLGDLSFSVTATESETGDQATTSMVQMVDSHISGLEYVTDSGVSGVTDSHGFLSLSKGEGVSLFVGDVVLGYVPSVTNTVYLHDIAGTSADDLSHDYVERLAVFLQSVDEDGDSSNGIVLSAATLAKFSGEDFDIQNATMDDVNLLLLSNDFVPVDASAAMQHVYQTLVDNGVLANNTGMNIDANDNSYNYVLDVTPLLSDVSSDCDILLVTGLPDDASLSMGYAVEAGWAIPVDQLRDEQGPVIATLQQPCDEFAIDYSLVNSVQDNVMLTQTVIEDYALVSEPADMALMLNGETYVGVSVVNEVQDNNDDLSDMV
jgi:hypothetical protein